MKQNISHSLVGQLKRRLFITTAILVFALAVRFVCDIYDTNAQYNLGVQKVELSENLNTILISMINQETGLRGYIATNNQVFLEPFTSGRPQYTTAVHRLEVLAINNDFSKTVGALIGVEARANDWYTRFALTQIKNMQVGNLAAARAESRIAVGKVLFDQFRAAMTHLQQASDEDTASLQTLTETRSWTTLVGALLLSLVAIIILCGTFLSFIRTLQKQLDMLKLRSRQLGSGEMATRVEEMGYDELNQLGQNLNTMADALSEQQQQLKERDVLESVLPLHAILASSLDFEVLITAFINELFRLLDIQLVALYLFDAQRELLALNAAQGFDQDEMQQQFRLGEGTIGRTALNRQPRLILRPTVDEAAGFTIKTMLGQVLPASCYQLPLLRGNELVGVLGVCSVYAMSEKTCNILDVVASTLATAIANTQAYQQINEQRQELETRSRKQEILNCELQRQRDELSTLNVALEEAHRARSQFLSTMSHELRTPLAAIIGFSQILLEQLNSGMNARQKSNLERILKNGRHLLTLINGVLDLAKIEAGRMEVNLSQVELEELLSSVVEETQSLAIQQHLFLETYIEEGIGTIETDALKLRQILLNLVSNALKFTSQGGVMVTATRITSNTPEQVAIAVKDSGIGIAPKIQGRIFEAFYQAEGGSTRKFGGTGLGLSIVRQLTHLLGGDITVESRPAEGSTFTLLLPTTLTSKQEGLPSLFAQPMHQDAAQIANSPHIEATHREHHEVLDTLFAVSSTDEAPVLAQNVVMAIDDNPDILRLITAALAGSPYRVVEVQDALTAVEMIQKLHPVAVTLDVMMPNLDGWQLLHQLKSNPATAHIPVVMLTVLAERTTGYVLGADEYLTKPFKNTVLLEALNRLITLQVSDKEASVSEVRTRMGAQF